MIKFYTFAIALMLLELQSWAFITKAIDSNSITLEVVDQKIKQFSIITADGKIHKADETGEMVFNSSRLKIKVSGLTKDESFTLKLYKRKPATNDYDTLLKTINIDKNGEIAIASEISSIKKQYNSNGLILLFSTKKDVRKVPIREVALVGDEVVETDFEVCANPVFYRSAQLGITDKKQNIKPYYIIQYDYNTIANGPNIFLTKNKSEKNQSNDTVHNDPSPKKPSPSGHVSVGRNATVVFKNFKPYYDKITLTKTFFDFHLEGQKTFSDLISGSKTSTNAAADKAADPGKTATTAGDKEKNEAAFITTLTKELEKFWSDVNDKEPRSEKVTAVLDQVKASIKACLGGPDLITAASLETFIKSKFKVVNTSELNRATTALQNLEDYSLYATNTFQIKNMDELRLNVSYFKNNIAVDVDTDPFVIPVLGGLKLDFSTGFLFSNLSDRKYFIADAPSVTRQETLPDGTVQDQTIVMKRVVEETNSKFKVGLGILSHFYPRMSKWFSVGLTSGFILKDNLAVQFPIGGSLMLGRESRIVLSGGKVFGEANRLSDRYTLKQDVEESTLTNVTSDTLVTKKFKSGWFFALTYNFGGTAIGK